MPTKILANFRSLSNRRVWTHLSLLLVFCFISSVNYGQGTPTLFSETTRLDIGFTPEQSTKLDNMIANPIYEDQYYVNVNDITTAQTDGNIVIELPDTGEELLFIGKNIEFTSLSDFIYYGELDPCDEEGSGYIQILSKNGNLFGQININDEAYDLQDYGGGKNVLFKYNNNSGNLFTEECNVESEINSNVSNGQTKQGFKSQSCDVRVLVLYTSAAESRGNPQNSARLFIQQSNQIMQNSEVPVHFVLAGVEELEDFEETDEIVETRDNLQEDGNANDLRVDKQADMVHLLTDGNWNNDVGISFLSKWGDADFAYSVSEIDFSGPFYTFTHELAHNFGCMHHNSTAGSPDFNPIARGRDFLTGTWPFRKKRFTLMRKLVPKTFGGFKDRIMHVTNPDVPYKNKHTGTTDRNNASQMSSMACTVSNYLPYTSPFSINISGPTKGRNNQLYTWCVNITSCPDPVSIIWEYSVDGFNFFPWAIGDLCTTSQLPYNKSLTLRVTVVCSDGHVDIDYHNVFNLDDHGSPCNPPIQDDTLDKVVLLTENNLINFTITPNPTSSKFNINYIISTDSEVKITMADLTGKRIKTISSSFQKEGEYSKEVNISDLKPGYYFVNINMAGNLITKSIIKI